MHSEMVRTQPNTTEIAVCPAPPSNTSEGKRCRGFSSIGRTDYGLSKRRFEP